MKISAVYIAKNEAKNIVHSLDSIKDATDELILVDTGSTDNTVEIFKSYGGQVYYQQWEDDFSAPRNLALSKASGDWIIILDADESFSGETRQNIKAVLESVSSDIKGLLINMINYDQDTGEALDEFYALRIVRNIKGLNYQGRIHEMLHIEDGVFSDIQRVSSNILSIDHTGYSSSISVEKNKRNLHMIQAAVSAGDPEERYYTNLYETYSALGDREKSLHYARLDVNRGRQPITYASRSYRGLMNYYAKSNSMADRLQRCHWAYRGVMDFPELPDFHAEYGESLYRLGCYAEASEEMERAISLYNDYDGLEPCLLSKEMIPLMTKRQQEMKEMADKFSKIKISACIIVKNEEENIGPWLNNVSVFSDEIIINDTGSDDDTKNIISQFSDEHPDLPMVLIESVWQDDFSFSKNQCLEEATGDWIVFTDADELFDNPELVRGYICSLDSNSAVQSIFVPMVNVDKDDNDNIINSFNSLRIFRKLEGIHYEGRIHENLSINDNDVSCIKSEVADEALLIRHTGYSGNINCQKAKRNLRLLLLDIEEGKDIRKLYFYLAQCYYTLQEWQKALDNALLAIQSDYQPIGQQGDMYWLALNAMEVLKYSIEERMILADNGIRLFPKIPDYYIRKGILLFEGKKYHEAIKIFTDVEELIVQYNNGNYKVSSNYMSSLHEFYTVWGRCLYKKGYSCAAEEKYKKALSINPWYDRAVCYWADIYQGRLDEEFLKGLTALFDEYPNSSIILAGIFATNGFPELADFFNEGNQLELINEKDYADIYNKSVREMADIIPTLSVCLLESYNEQYVNLLPENLQTVIRYFHQKNDVGNIEDCFETYLTILQEVVLFANECTVDKYLNLLDIFSKNEEEENIIKTADKLLEINEYKLALALYQQILDESTNSEGALWQKTGICYYGLGQYQKAMENLQRGTNDKKTDTYKVWCQEAMKDGN